MTKVKAPNGDVYDLDDAVASGLISSTDSGWTAVDAERKPKKGKSAKETPATGDDSSNAAPAASGSAPKGNASRDDWAAHAVELGLEVPDDATRDDIKALVATHTAD